MSEPKWEDTEELPQSAAPAEPKWEDTEELPTLAEDAAADVPVEMQLPKTSAGDALLSGAGQSILMNFGDEAVGVVGATKDKVEAALGQRGDIDWNDARKTWRDAVRRGEAVEKEEHPGFYATGQGLGGVLLGAGGGAALQGMSGASTVGQAAGTASKLLNPSLGSLKSAKTWGDMAKSMSTMGAISGAGASESEDVAGVAADAAIGGVTGAVLSPAAVLLGKGIDKGAQLAGKGVANFLGKGDVADDYLKNAAQVNRKDINFLDIEDQMNSAARPIRDAADDSAEALAAARADYAVKQPAVRADAQDLKAAAKLADADIAASHAAEDSAIKDLGSMYKMKAQAYKDEVLAAQRQFAEAEKGTAAELRAAKAAYDKAVKRAEVAFKADLKSRQVPAEAVDATRDALKAVNARGRALADEQGEALAGYADQKIDMTGLHKQLTEAIEKRKIAGHLDPQDTQGRYLEMLKERLERRIDKDTIEIPELSPSEVIRLRQNTPGGAFNLPDGRRVSGADALARGHRAELNKLVDSVDPENSQLARIRGDLSENLGLGEKAGNLFGRKTPDATAKALSRLSGPNAAEQRAILEQLGGVGGDDILAKLRPYEEAKATLADPKAFSEAFAKTNPGSAERAALEELASQASSGRAARETELAALSQRNAELSRAAEQDMAEVWERIINNQADARATAAGRLDATKAGIKQRHGTDDLDGLLGGMDKNLADANAAAEQAKSAARGLRDVVSEKEGAQSTIRKILFSGKTKPETLLKERVKEFGEQTGDPELLHRLEMLRIKERLGKGGPQGSRLVNIGRSAGRAVGGNVGEAVGGLAAGAIDYGSGRAAKLALDSALAVGRNTPRTLVGLTPMAIDKLQGTPYLRLLDEAASRGPEALGVTHQMLLKDEQYRKAVQGD